MCSEYADETIPIALPMQTCVSSLEVSNMILLCLSTSGYCGNIMVGALFYNAYSICGINYPQATEHYINRNSWYLFRRGRCKLERKHDIADIVLYTCMNVQSW